MREWRADVDAMEAAIDDDTVLVVGSAPQYPQGVIDPITDIAALAAKRDINCHVDACMGGVTLTYMHRLGEPVPPWNFEVPGVTSISVDLHKYGYTAKGASVIMHRTKQLRCVSDIRHRQLARRCLRLVWCARHEGRWIDRRRVGSDALPRRRRIHASDRRGQASLPRAGRCHRRDSRAAISGATRRHVARFRRRRRRDTRRLRRG